MLNIRAEIPFSKAKKCFDTRRKSVIMPCSSPLYKKPVISFLKMWAATKKF